jgi:hypothetical protein
MHGSFGACIWLNSPINDFLPVAQSSMIVSQRINAKPMTNSELLLIFLTFFLINATRTCLLPELPIKLLLLPLKYSPPPVI